VEARDIIPILVIGGLIYLAWRREEAVPPPPPEEKPPIPQPPPPPPYPPILAPPPEEILPPPEEVAPLEIPYPVELPPPPREVTPVPPEKILPPPRMEIMPIAVSPPLPPPPRREEILPPPRMEIMPVSPPPPPEEPRVIRETEFYIFEERRFPQPQPPLGILETIPIPVREWEIVTDVYPLGSEEVTVAISDIRTLKYRLVSYRAPPGYVVVAWGSSGSWDVGDYNAWITIGVRHLYGW
jgi:hypothetical protein